MKQLSKAIALASKEFDGRLDKGGSPYILHCLYVMYNCNSTNEDTLVAAVLHDLIEDTQINESDLITKGFTINSVKIILKVTHEKDETYDDYIKKVSTCPEATKIKLADLKHNSDITRLKGLRERDFRRLEKYCRAFSYLRKKLI